MTILIRPKSDTLPQFRKCSMIADIFKLTAWFRKIPIAWCQLSQKLGFHYLVDIRIILDVLAVFFMKIHRQLHPDRHRFCGLGWRCNLEVTTSAVILYNKWRFNPAKAKFRKKNCERPFLKSCMIVCSRRFLMEALNRLWESIHNLRVNHIIGVVKCYFTII